MHSIFHLYSFLQWVHKEILNVKFLAKLKSLHKKKFTKMFATFHYYIIAHCFVCTYSTWHSHCNINKRIVYQTVSLNRYKLLRVLYKRFKHTLWLRKESTLPTIFVTQTFKVQSSKLSSQHQLTCAYGTSHLQIE